MIVGRSENFKLDFNYGYQLRKIPTIINQMLSGRNDGQFAHIAVTLAY